MANMELIETKTVTGSTVANIEFTSIPNTYTDLIVKFTCRTDHPNGVTNFEVSFNGVTSSLSGNRLIGLGGSGTSAEANGYGLSTGNSATSNVFTNAELFIPNYASAKYKTFTLDCAAENGSSTAYVTMVGGKWASTAAINAVKLTPNAGNGWLPGSTFSLYGVSKVTSSPKATGGIVSQDATYWYHTFPFSSTFTPTQALSADILCIAGGGGTGVNFSAGAGAGGLLAFTSQSLSATGYSVTVGAGGTGSGSAGGTNGGNSQFGALTAAVGGGTGMYGGNSKSGGSAGGSGGGATDSITTGFAGTSGQGNAGGGASGSTNGGTGGGGGAGAAAAQATFSKSSDGGVGSSAYSSWGLATFTGQIVGGTAYFAGGGGGGSFSGNQGSSIGAGGLGGGGNGGNNSQPLLPVAGLPNTGGGAGGAGANSQAGVNGGSGLVIVRYAK